ncbi:uncharacterized protein B0T15DRAFT_212729 [Chaetomium strumarium]|uniref:Uncharacterized protein n=1 Tax=Chaetomium strumarium TaxID=1170767 RepID=A0AAJ0GTK2_9PEZI|nr:hypothetical protein B0T15DRAFT_212729 [Chaetomium strumarium]
MSRFVLPPLSCQLTCLRRRDTLSASLTHRLLSKSDISAPSDCWHCSHISTIAPFFWPAACSGPVAKASGGSLSLDENMRGEKERKTRESMFGDVGQLCLETVQQCPPMSSRKTAFISLMLVASPSPDYALHNTAQKPYFLPWSSNRGNNPGTDSMMRRFKPRLASPAREALPTYGLPRIVGLSYPLSPTLLQSLCVWPLSLFRILLFFSIRYRHHHIHCLAVASCK